MNRYHLLFSNVSHFVSFCLSTCVFCFRTFYSKKKIYYTKKFCKVLLYKKKKNIKYSTHTSMYSQICIEQKVPKIERMREKQKQFNTFELGSIRQIKQREQKMLYYTWNNPNEISCKSIHL